MPETTQFPNMGNDSNLDGSLKSNTVLLARYKIMGVIGGGGMGTVYQARDLNFPDVKRLVAIKEMLASSTDANARASNLKSFQREANILATLTHPAIPKIYDSFIQNERAYLVMEYINGVDIEALMNKTKELPNEKIIEWAIDLCDVLDYLHRNQPDPIIFRDMKPSNIMIDSLGKVRLIDFGIAKNFIATAGKHTMIGTEGYSAPEQYRGEVTPISDIYSLGATLHHILTRKDPRLETPFSFSERPIKNLNAKVPQQLVDIVMRAVAYEARDRFANCTEMKVALEKLRYAQNSPIALSSTPSVANLGAVAQPPSQSRATPASAPQTSTMEDFLESGSSSTTHQKAESGATIQPRWKFVTEDEIRCSPTTFRDLAIIGSYDTNVWAVKSATGELAWKFPTKGGIASSPAVDAETKLVVFGSEDKNFYAVEALTGRISWTFPTKEKIRGSARVAHGHAFFGSDDGFVYAVSLANGRQLWKYDTLDAVRSRPFVTNDLVIVGSESGELTAIELSGKRKWSYRTKKNVTSSPYVDEKENLCLVGSMDGYLYALAANSGFSSWRFRTGGPIISSPVTEDGLVYFGCTDGYVYAVNIQSGKEKWKFNANKPIVSSPIVHKGLVYIGSTDNFLYCLDATNGKERWRFAAKGAITSTPCIADNMILIGSLDKTLYALPLVG